MTRFRVLMVAAVLIHVGITVAVANEMPVLAAVFGACVFLSLVGAVLMASGNEIFGSSLFMVGCVPFLPIGFVGIIAAQRVSAGPSGTDACAGQASPPTGA